MASMPTVRFLPSGATAEVDVGTTLFDAGAKVQAGIDTACVGKGTCGLCRVKVIDGVANLGALTDEDTKHLGNVFHINQVRLACRAIVHGDVTVEVVIKRKPNKPAKPPAGPPPSRDRGPRR